MPRVLMLSFKDNDAAEAVVQAVDELQQVEEEYSVDEYMERTRRLGSIMAAGATPRILMAIPTRGCKCKYPVNPRNRVKTKRFGWYVCPNCNLPAQVVVNNWMRNLLASVMGNNLLPELRAKLADRRGRTDAEARVPPGITVHDQQITDPELAAAFEATYGARPAGPVIHSDFVVKGTITGRLPAPEGSVHEPPLQ